MDDRFRRVSPEPWSTIPHNNPLMMMEKERETRQRMMIHENMIRRRKMIQARKINRRKFIPWDSDDSDINDSFCIKDDSCRTRMPWDSDDEMPASPKPTPPKPICLKELAKRVAILKKNQVVLIKKISMT